MNPSDRILILAPHPDDEVLGCAGIIQAAIRMHLPVHVVFLTYGDNNEISFFLYRKHPVLLPKAVRGMGELRRAEAQVAAEILGVPRDHLIFLGYPDWGTFPMWTSHWDESPPYKSMLTRVTAVPYADAFRPGAAYRAEEVVRDIQSILEKTLPTKVFVSHPADGHPDHRALYLFTRVALWGLERRIVPVLYPYLVHYRGWPRWSKDRSTVLLVPPDSLPQVQWQMFPLDPQEIGRKEEALLAHRSQYKSGPKSLGTFVRPNELFGDLPTLSLSRSSAAGFSPDDSKGSKQMPEELSEQERLSFVGVEWQSIRLDGEDLCLSFDFSKPLAKEVSASISVFGYRADRSFGEMPKLQVRLGVARVTLWDRGRRLPVKMVEVIRETNRITVRLPLEVLGYPQRILTTAHTSLGQIPLDWVSWRVIEIHP